MQKRKSEDTRKTDLARAIAAERVATPKPATLDLQRRPRAHAQQRVKAFLRIDRGYKA
ncbi:hypothetical protein SAMN04488515_2886 [Cognatiyoonia koreensis]|uniref:Uncharacterized protein n=1 Tax=Cognatiyoonia koreensis TaxID=364200 RepID=A0A1I0RLB8_9RHOB|nr:hypothetical protein [Cognatiyoonia koreensis]SEW41827.1 hypothetical protein SAMN04488515_2886 [Cognatiyoonia koreensis]